MEHSRQETTSPGQQTVSVIVPLLDEAESLIELTRQIRNALESFAFEIIFIDDGSSDHSWSIIEQLHHTYPAEIKGLRHRRNFGKADALSAGFLHARFPYIVTMDADLQDMPEEIPNLLAELDRGYDLVSGWKAQRNDPLSKTLPSKVFNTLTRAFTGVKLNDFNCGLKAYRTEVVQSIQLYGELHRFIPVLAHAKGFSIKEVVVKHQARQHGTSKYGWSRLFKGFLDLLTVVLLTRYLRRPGHLFGGIGILNTLLGSGILFSLTYQKIVHQAHLSNRPLLFLGILLVITGVQFFSFGLIGELMQFHANRQKRFQPTHTIKERLGLS